MFKIAQALSAAPPKKPSKKKKLRGEKYEFRPLSVPGHLSARDLTPPQHLSPEGKVESSRAHEVTRGADPLIDSLYARITQLEAIIAEQNRIIQDMLENK